MIDTPHADAVVPSVSIAALLNLRDGIMSRFEHAHQAMVEAHRMLDESPVFSRRDLNEKDELKACRIGVSMPSVEVRKTGYRYDRSYALHEADAVNGTRQMIDASMWNFLLHESGLWSFMDSKAREEWSKQVGEFETPPLTRENIEATFATIHVSRFDMLERGIIECFRQLSWNYKTNEPFRFGKRLVLRFIRGEHTKNKLDDLVRFFSVIDGKPEPDHRHAVSSAIGYWSDAKEIDHEYMHIRTFKNGNGHLKFKRLDLIEKLNAVLAKHYPGALPHDRHAA